ncbi:MAG: hypothetical protein SGJ27_29030 [Candidatus Melainabacteria bacterium]|nr:hypothetical protein [Candidatus Melainabacteria bacterium]
MGSERDNNSPLRELEWLSKFYEKRGRKDLVQDIMSNLHNIVPSRRKSGEQNAPNHSGNGSREGN